MKYKFLIVDDDLNLAVNLSKIIKENMFNFIETVNICDNGAKAIKEIDKVKPDILLLDLKMPKANGLTVIDKIKEKSIVVIIMSGEVSMINSLKIFNSKNVKKIYIKPFLFEHLINELKYICYEKDNENIIKNIKNELSNFEFNKNSIGYQYLVECLLNAYKNPESLNNIEKNLFPLVAKKFRVDKIQNVKWCIQKSMKSMIRYTDRKKIIKYFPSREIPTIKLFIITLNNLIVTKYKI